MLKKGDSSKVVLPSGPDQNLLYALDCDVNQITGYGIFPTERFHWLQSITASLCNHLAGSQCKVIASMENHLEPSQTPDPEGLNTNCMHQRGCRKPKNLTVEKQKKAQTKTVVSCEGMLLMS